MVSIAMQRHVVGRDVAGHLTMTDPRIIRTRDTERAIADLAREHQALAGMTGADSARIDGLVKDVGTINGNVQAVREKVDDVADGVNELRDALTVLVRHDVKMQHHDQEVAALRKDVSDVGSRVMTLEKQIGPVMETRGWIIGGGLGILALIGLAVAKLVMMT